MGNFLCEHMTVDSKASIRYEDGMGKWRRDFFRDALLEKQKWAKRHPLLSCR